MQHNPHLSVLHQAKDVQEANCPGKHLMIVAQREASSNKQDVCCIDAVGQKGPESHRANLSCHAKNSNSGGYAGWQAAA